MSKPIVGFVSSKQLNANDPSGAVQEYNLWTPVYDNKELLEAEPERVSYTTDRDQFIAELKAQYPDIAPNYGYISGDTNISSNSIAQSPEPTFRVSTYNTYNKKDFEQLGKLVHQHGRVKMWMTYNFIGNKDKIIADIPGCVYQRGCLVYDPKKAKALAQKKQSREIKTPELREFMYSFYWKFPADYHKALDTKVSGVQNIEVISKRFNMFILIAQKCFGKKFLRQSLKELLARWKKNRAGNLQLYTGAGPEATRFAATIEQLIGGKAPATRLFPSRKSPV